MRISKREKERELGENNIIIIDATCDTRAVTRIPTIVAPASTAMEKGLSGRVSLFWRHSPEDWGKPHSVFQIVDVGGSETKKKKRVEKKDARRTRQVAVNVPRESLIKINGSTKKEKESVLRALATSEIKKLLDAVCEQNQWMKRNIVSPFFLWYILFFNL